MPVHGSRGRNQGDGLAGCTPQKETATLVSSCLNQLVEGGAIPIVARETTAAGNRTQAEEFTVLSSSVTLRKIVRTGLVTNRSHKPRQAIKIPFR